MIFHMQEMTLVDFHNTSVLVLVEGFKTIWLKFIWQLNITVKVDICYNLCSFYVMWIVKKCLKKNITSIFCLFILYLYIYIA